MCPLCRLVVMAFWFFVRAASLLAQPPVDPSGHWQGVVQLGDAPLVFEVDVTRDAKGGLAATFAQPSAGIKGFPFSTVVLDGRTLRLVLKAGAQPSTFVGTVSDDRKTIAGEVEQADQKTTFTLTRVGDARVAAVPKSGRVSQELEGTWNGALDVDGKQMRLIVSLANHADGTASGTVVSPDGSGIEIPVKINETGSEVAIDVPSVGASFAGTFNAAKSELKGTWTQGAVSLPLTLRRGAPRQD